MPHLSFNAPVGPVSLFEEDGHIIALDWGWPPTQEPSPLLEEACDQLAAYFDGKLRQFNLPLKPSGTAFQLKVWDALTKIEWGHVLTYGALATKLSSGPRAIGTACGRNPIPILIPCHRVVGSKGSLGGYSGYDGVETKEYLLKREGYLK